MANALTALRETSHESTKDRAELLPVDLLKMLPLVYQQPVQSIPEMEPMNTADRMKAEALAIFDDSECPQETRDVIEWYHASMLVQQEQAGFRASLDFLKRVQESLSDYCGGLDWGNADMDLMDEVESMITAAPKQKQAGWISTKDRMPEPEVKVLTFSDYSSDPVISFWMGKDYNWIPTHWQPLPAAPKQGEKP